MPSQPRSRRKPKRAQPLAKTIRRPRITATDSAPASNVTTKAFWPLIDRLGVSDEDALQLLGRRMAPSGRRPRFRLTVEEATRLEFLRQVEIAVVSVVGGPEWLNQPSPALPFSGLSPLRYMIARGLPGLSETLRFLNRRGFAQPVR